MDGLSKAQLLGIAIMAYQAMVAIDIIYDMNPNPAMSRVDFFANFNVQPLVEQWANDGTADGGARAAALASTWATIAPLVLLALEIIARHPLRPRIVVSNAGPTMQLVLAWVWDVTLVGEFAGRFFGLASDESRIVLRDVLVCSVM